MFKILKFTNDHNSITHSNDNTIKHKTKKKRIMKILFLLIFTFLSKISVSQKNSFELNPVWFTWKRDMWYTTYREFQYGNERRYYDVCGSGNLDTVKKLYKNFSYIGSGNTIYINGVCNEWEEILHFFVGNLNDVYIWTPKSEFIDSSWRKKNKRIYLGPNPVK